VGFCLVPPPLPSPDGQTRIKGTYYFALAALREPSTKLRGIVTHFGKVHSIVLVEFLLSFCVGDVVQESVWNSSSPCEGFSVLGV